MPQQLAYSSQPSSGAGMRERSRMVPGMGKASRRAETRRGN